MRRQSVTVTVTRVEDGGDPLAILQVETVSEGGETSWTSYEMGRQIDQRKEGICEATMALWNLLAVL